MGFPEDSPLTGERGVDMEDPKVFERNAVEAAIKIALVAALVVWTYQIIRPFIIPVVWGAIIAVAVDPFIGRCASLLRGRRRLVAVLFALGVMILLVVPLVFLSASTFNALQPYAKNMGKLHLNIPLPPESVRGWPLIGSYVSKMWTMASVNLGGLLKHFQPQIKALLRFLLGLVGGGVKAVLVFVISIVIATVFLATSEKVDAALAKVMRRLAGDRGDEIKRLATATIRAVMLGIVGVAAIQSVLAALGMLVVGVPMVGLWAVLVLVCAVCQLPVILVLGPVAAWVFFVKDSTPLAVGFLVWSVVVSMMDNILKPIFMGRGVDIPMLVIFVGALGGMMLSGIIDLFIGAVVVAITYKLFMAWVDEGEGEGGADPGAQNARG